VCALARDFLQEQDFTGSNLIRTDHVGKTGSSRLQRGARSTPEHSSPDCEHAGAASVEKAPVFRGSSVALEARKSKFLSVRSCSMEEIPG
jgi:hypothetical protein